MDLVATFSDLNVVCFDVNTVGPPQDPANMSALMASTVMVEFLLCRSAAMPA